MERKWDIELINDREDIYERLKKEPQLCMVINKDIQPKYLFNIVNDYYVFACKIDEEDRTMILMGAYKGDIGEDPKKTQQAFGREVKEQIFDDLVSMDGVPYLPFCRDVDPNIVSVMQQIYDIQDIVLDLVNRKAVLCHYYDHNNQPETAGHVISQLDPVILN